MEEKISFTMNYGSLIIKRGYKPIKIIETINEEMFSEDIRKSQIVKYVDSEIKDLVLTNAEKDYLKQIMVNKLTNYFFVEDYEEEV